MERQQVKILEVKERQPIGDRGAVKLAFQGYVNEHKYWFFTFSKRLFETIESSGDKTLEMDVDTTTRETESATFIDRKVTEIYIDGKPVGGQMAQKQGWRGKSPEELELSRKSYSLSYAKDLAVADRIKVSEIIEQAQKFDDWLSGNDKTVKPTATTVKKTAPKTATPESEQASSEADNTKSQTDELLSWVAEKMKFKTEKTARNWLNTVCKIDNERIDSDPQGVAKEVAELQGWN